MSLAEPVTGDRAVGFLDYSDLQCCGKQMESATYSYGGRNTRGYACSGCLRFVTQIGFMQNHHGTREARRARLREMNYATA